MTFDLTPEQQDLIARAAALTSLPPRALDAVLAIEERSARQGGDEALSALGGREHLQPLLMAAAAALGIGRAAVAHAREWMVSNGIKADPDQSVPHWAFADGATEVAAARMLTYEAAQMVDRGEEAGEAVARAHAFAANAALRAIDAAIRVVGYSKGSVLDRLNGEARTLQRAPDA
jgi:hypothetical protein